jgi:hypothetical protein
MWGVLAAVRAELFELQAILVLPLVLVRGVVAVFARLALQGDHDPLGWHGLLHKKKT